jgi:hypothetical protein
MKLLELIVELQKIESRRPGIEVCFEMAKNGGGEGDFSHSPLTILAIKSENGQGHCLLTLGDWREDVRQYKEYLEGVRARFPARH